MGAHIQETAAKRGPVGGSAAWDAPSSICEGPSSLRLGELGVERGCGPSPHEALDVACAKAAAGCLGPVLLQFFLSSP